MKYLFAAALAVITAASFAGTANAAGGCGPGWYRDVYGACVPKRVAPRVVVVRPAPRVVVVPPRRGPVCPYGMYYAYGRCR